MNRNELTTIDKLKPGDRFYKSNVTSKTKCKVFELISLDKVAFNKFTKVQHWAILTNIMDNPIVRDREKYAQPFAASTSVIFLYNRLENEHRNTK